MADHIVRCMATPPSLSGLTTDTSRCTAGTCLDTPTALCILRLEPSLAPASAQTHFSIVRYPHIWGRHFPRREELLTACGSGNLAWVELSTCCRVPVSMCFRIYNGMLPLSEKYTLLRDQWRDPSNTFSSGYEVKDGRNVARVIEAGKK